MFAIHYAIQRSFCFVIIIIIIIIIIRFFLVDVGRISDELDANTGPKFKGLNRAIGTLVRRACCATVFQLFE
jgi:hypothetical protein